MTAKSLVSLIDKSYGVTIGGMRNGAPDFRFLSRDKDKKYYEFCILAIFIYASDAPRVRAL